jgi:rSAM/selenodomain-associated transferase 2
MLSVIIPTYNEEDAMPRTLEALSRVRGDFEVVVVDGESADRTGEYVRERIPDFPKRLRLFGGPRPRALQLNAGAGKARGDVLLFLHADVIFPCEGVETLERALRDQAVVGGNFDLEFEGPSAWSRFFTWVNRQRRRFGIYYGDSGIFVRRTVFNRLGGFRPIPIMDDYEFVRRLETAGKTYFIPARLLASSRRWRERGVWRTMWSWFWVQTLYSLGVPTRFLARWYLPVRAKPLRVSAPTSEVVTRSVPSFGSPVDGRKGSDSGRLRS